MLKTIARVLLLRVLPRRILPIVTVVEAVLFVRSIRNRSQSCCAINGSRSQAATILQPLIRWICAACESAILPHPMMATLSMRGLLTAAPEVELQRL